MIAIDNTVCAEGQDMIFIGSHMARPSEREGERAILFEGENVICKYLDGSK